VRRGWSVGDHAGEAVGWRPEVVGLENMRDVVRQRDAMVLSCQGASLS